ncbi:hypothetical protein MTO96_006485 [Rhipicephalus appendiculatus]
MTDAERGADGMKWRDPGRMHPGAPPPGHGSCGRVPDTSAELATKTRHWWTYLNGRRLDSSGQTVASNEVAYSVREANTAER